MNTENNECYFITDKKGTSATICANCGKEKMLHTIGEGVKASKVIIQSTPAIDDGGKKIKGMKQDVRDNKEDISSDAMSEKYKLMQDYYPVFTSDQATAYRSARMDFGLGFDKAASFFQQKISEQKKEIERLKELLHNALDIED